MNILNCTYNTALYPVEPEAVIIVVILVVPSFILYRGGQVYNIDLINPELKRKKKKYTNSGTLNLVSVK